MSERDVTWGIISDQEQAVFGLTPLVADLGVLRTAISDAATWGEFRRAITTERVRELEDNLEELPPDDEPFDPTEIFGYGDGDWPEWLHQEMLGWIPGDLIAQFGSVQESVLNGPMAEIPADAGAAMAAELETHGFHCVHDDELVTLAAGWS